MNMNEDQKKGSKTAKDGFKNEQFVVDCFNNWKDDSLAQDWLKEMKYILIEIQHVKAEKIIGHYKADIQVQVEIKLKNLTDSQNIQVKLVSNETGFNQIDKRWVDKYQELWNIPEATANIFKHFTGELSPYVKNPEDPRRMYIGELSEADQKNLLSFLNEKKMLIVSDILKGQGKFSAEWMLVIVKENKIKITGWALKPINEVMNYYGNGDIRVTKQRGIKRGIKIGNITMQRKGGDGGRSTAKMLQFKINPAELLKI